MKLASVLSVFFPFGGRSSSAPAIPADLLEAIVAWLHADGALMAELPGGVWSDQGPESDDAVLPYLIIIDPQDSVSTGSTTDGDYFDSGTFQFSVYVEQADKHEAKDLARKIIWDVEARLNDAPLAFARGRLSLLRQQGPSQGERDPDPGPQGLPVYHQWLTMAYIVSRTF